VELASIGIRPEALGKLSAGEPVPAAAREFVDWYVSRMAVRSM
jgi:hypothetical protein